MLGGQIVLCPLSISEGVQLPCDPTPLLILCGYFFNVPAVQGLRTCITSAAMLHEANIVLWQDMGVRQTLLWKAIRKGMLLPALQSPHTPPAGRPSPP